jgi:colanic acid biosynthesis protein WcaH
MSNFGWIEEPQYSKIKQLMPLPCVDLLIIFKGRLLLMKRKNNPGKGLWFTPGGRIYRHESLESAVRRVLKEETGLDAHSIYQIGAMSHYWPKVHTVTIFYKINVSSDKLIMNDEHDDYRWIDKKEKDLHPYVVHMIRKSGIL